MKKMMIPTTLLLLLAACHSGPEQTGTLVGKEIRVATAVVKKEKVTASLRYSGTVEPFQRIPLTFETTGTVEKVMADAGDAVRKGQLLARLDPTDAKSMYEITLSQYQQARDAYDRLKTVHDQGSLPEIKWVEMENKLEQAKSSLDLSKNNLKKCNLISPVDGIVGKRNIEPGMSAISITAAPFELVDICQVYIKISVPENEVAAIGKGMKARFTVSAMNNREFSGTVSNISPVADRISRTYEAKILLPNPDQALKPGMVCDLSMSKEVEKEIILVPNQSVSKDNKNQTYVYVVDTGAKRARRQIITTGACRESGIEVLSGLEPGQVIVAEGKEKLTDSCQITF